MSFDTVIPEELQWPQQEQEQQQRESGGLPGIVGGRIVRLLGEYVDKHNLGWVSGAETEYKWPGLDYPKRPDAAFITAEHLAFPDLDAIPFAPDIAVEVISKTDSLIATATKAVEYLEADTQLVWIVNPATRVIEVYKVGDVGPSQFLRVNDVLDGGDVLPGFTMKVGEIFERIPITAAFKPAKGSKLVFSRSTDLNDVNS